MGTELALPMWRMSPSHPAYDVDTLGRVRRGVRGRGARRGRLVKPQVYKSGYVYVHLWHKSNRDAVRLNRLAFEAFHGPIPKGYEVNHKDGEKLNNAPLNLEAVTPSENVQHAYDELGRDPACFGSDHHNAKLTEDDVLWMRKVWPKWKKKGRTQEELGKVVGVSDSVVSRIVNKQSWKHV